MNNRLINTKVAGGGGGCTDIVDNYDPFGGGVSLWQLNGNADDVSGNYNGTASNVTYGTGVFGQAGVFNGSNSKITTVASQLPIPASGAFTVSFWAKVDSSLTQYNTCMMSFGDFWLKSEYPNGEFGLGDINTTERTTTSMGYNWNHCVLTVDASNNISLYLNGAEEFNGNKSISRTNGGNFAIGVARLSNPVYYFNGELDQVRIFNTALDPLEVEALYTEELCICDGTVDTLDILGDGSCIATYQLDGNANDLSGSYSGTPTDVSYGVGEFDLGAVANGTSTRINTGYIQNGQVFSVSFWGRNFSAWGSVIRDTPAAGGANTRINIIANGAGGIALGGNYAIDPPTTGKTVWTHYVVTASGSVAKIYENTVEVASVSYTEAGGNNGTPVCMFSNGLYPVGFGEGELDQVRIFNKALNSTEVTTLYNETACTYTPPREAGVTQILGDTSCIAYYKLDGTDVDETGSYNGNFLNSNYGKGEFGQYSALFNGIDTRIVVPNRPLYTMGTGTPFSISAWVKLHSLSSSGSIYAELAGGNTQYKLFYESTGVFEFHGYYGFQNTGARTTTPIQAGVWYHLVGTVNSGTCKIYLNGQYENEFIGSAVNRSNFTNYDAEFGAFVNGGGEKLDGQIDQVRFFNKTISPSEVTTLYNEGI